MSINTRIVRHGAGLFTIGAVAALAAGCGAGPTPTDSPAAEAGAGQSDVHVAVGADGEQIKTVEGDAQDAAKSKGKTEDKGSVSDGDHGKPGGDHAKSGGDHGKAGGDHKGKGGDHKGQDGDHQGGDGNHQGGDNQGGDDQGDDNQGGDDETAPPTAELPDSWAGTVSTERFAPGDATAYLAMVNMHGDYAATSMTAEKIEGTEFLGGLDAQCDGDADLDGAFSNCTFVDVYGDGSTQFAQVRLVPTGFGNTALLFGVSGESATDLAVAPGVAHGLQSMDGNDPSAVTAESMQGDAIGAVLLGYRMDGDIPEGVSADCEVIDGGAHGVCEVAGTPDGGGDGTWYATAQRGYDGDRYAYLFTQLPQE